MGGGAREVFLPLRGKAGRSASSLLRRCTREENFLVEEILCRLCVQMTAISSFLLHSIEPPRSENAFPWRIFIDRCSVSVVDFDTQEEEEEEGTR